MSRVLFFAFAQDSMNLLPNLWHEQYMLNLFLAPQMPSFDYYFIHGSFKEVGKMLDFLDEMQDEIQLFHFSGHANSKFLSFEKDEGAVEKLAEILSQCPNLKVVVLNGCATQKFAKILRDKNVPIVIATYSSVKDKSASIFSINFYKKLVSGKSLKESFNWAAPKADISGNQIFIQRGLSPRAQFNQNSWGLFGLEKDLDWRLIYSFEKNNPLNSNEIKGSQFKDLRDNEIYETVMIGNKEWMAQNLRFKVISSKLYKNSTKRKIKYGRLYNWEAANMACPPGWRLPSVEEWHELIQSFEKKKGNSSRKNVIDLIDGGATGINLTFSGYYDFLKNEFKWIGESGLYWTNKENSAKKSWYILFNNRSFPPYNKNSFDKNNLISCRCLRDIN